MYYYIFDLKKCRKRSSVEDIKNYLSYLGIAGEYTYPSAAYTVEDLVELGIGKNYNTIVGIGGDEVANKIAGKLCGKSAAMGIIPVEASDHLSKLIRVKSWKDSAEALRFRKIENIKIGKTANGGSFLTSIKLDINLPVEVTIEFRDFIVQGKIKNLMVSNFNPDIEKTGPDFLDIIFESVDREAPVLAKISNLFGLNKQKKDESLSLFRARSLRLFTSAQIPLRDSEGNLVGKTPQLIESSDEDLRLICGKATGK